MITVIRHIVCDQAPQWGKSAKMNQRAKRVEPSVGWGRGRGGTAPSLSPSFLPHPLPVSSLFPRPESLFTGYTTRWISTKKFYKATVAFELPKIDSCTKRAKTETSRKIIADTMFHVTIMPIMSNPMLGRTFCR